MISRRRCQYQEGGGGRDVGDNHGDGGAGGVTGEDC